MTFLSVPNHLPPDLDRALQEGLIKVGPLTLRLRKDISTAIIILDASRFADEPMKDPGFKEKEGVYCVNAFNIFEGEPLGPNVKIVWLPIIKRYGYYIHNSSSGELFLYPEKIGLKEFSNDISCFIKSIEDPKIQSSPAWAGSGVAGGFIHFKEDLSKHIRNVLTWPAQERNHEMAKLINHLEELFNFGYQKGRLSYLTDLITLYLHRANSAYDAKNIAEWRRWLSKTLPIIEYAEQVGMHTTDPLYFVFDCLITHSMIINDKVLFVEMSHRYRNYLGYSTLEPEWRDIFMSIKSKLWPFKKRSFKKLH